MRIAVLASGSGSILAALASAELPLSVVAVDRACLAEEIATRAGVPVVRVERRDFGSGFDRSLYTERLVEALEPHRVHLIVMAGFATVLAPQFFETYGGMVLNTHPALLPSFKGWHAVEAALDAGVDVTGCTVHVATPEVDAGPVLAQEAVKVLPGDTAPVLHERIKAVERRLYPATVRAVLDAGDPMTVAARWAAATRGGPSQGADAPTFGVMDEGSTREGTWG